MKTFLFTVYIIINIASYSYASEGSWSLGEGTQAIFYLPEISKICYSCITDVPSLELNIVNPVTCQIEDSIPLPGNFKYVCSVDNGDNIIILTGESDGTHLTEEGLLYKLNLSTHETTNQIAFDRWPLTMCIDNCEDYAYVASGMSEPGKLTKVSLDNFQVVTSIDYGDLSDEIAITPDSTKIYINNKKSFRSNNELGKCWNIGVFNTYDLSARTPIEVLHSTPILMMGSNSLLYVSFRPMWGPEDPALMVVDTINNDQIIETFCFGDAGLWLMDIDPSGQKLYCTTFQKTWWDEELQDYVPAASNLIMEIDLSDYSNRYIEFSQGHLWDISVAEVNGTNRIFCTDPTTASIYWKDAE